MIGFLLYYTGLAGFGTASIMSEGLGNNTSG